MAQPWQKLHPSRYFPEHIRSRHFARSGWLSRPPSMHSGWEEADSFASWAGGMSPAVAECPTEFTGDWAARADGQLPTPSSCRVQSGSARISTFPLFKATACLAPMRPIGCGTRSTRGAAYWIDRGAIDNFAFCIDVAAATADDASFLLLAGPSSEGYAAADCCFVCIVCCFRGQTCDALPAQMFNLQPQRCGGSCCDPLFHKFCATSFLSTAAQWETHATRGPVA
mmetsp:Transcript_22342/g.42762  ORF Transcript_22342/g.42762 Transcript_22342/m.42762 type:complete len:226 (+) Transcript_22342:1037-1714(+)